MRRGEPPHARFVGPCSQVRIRLMAEDLPRRGAARPANLASRPRGAAAGVAAGWGKRLTGRSAEEIQADVTARTAEQVFAVLGELKGGAMKFGQALSVFEAAIPN